MSGPAYPEMTPSMSLDLIDGYLALEKVAELEDILGITACGCGDVVAAVKTLKAENQRLRERIMEYERESR